MRHLVLAILCVWLSGMQEHMLRHTSCIPDSHPVYATLGTLYYVCMFVWCAGAYGPVYLLHTRQSSSLCVTCYLLFCVDDCLVLCENWYLLFCVYGCLVCRSICSCIPPAYLLHTSHPVYATLGTCYSVWMTCLVCRVE